MGCTSSTVPQDNGGKADSAPHDRQHKRQSSALILMSEDNRATADQRMMLRARHGSKSAVLRTISTGWHKGENYVVRIAITGGPSGGKSQATELITRKLTANGFNVFTDFEISSFTCQTLDETHTDGFVGVVVHDRISIFVVSELILAQNKNRNLLGKEQPHCIDNITACNL